MTNLEKEVIRLDDEALHYLLHSRKGRWFLMRLLDRAYINMRTFDPDNMNLTAFNEGRRSLGIEYLGMLIQTPQRIKLKQKAEMEYAEIKSRMELLDRKQEETKEPYVAVKGHMERSTP